MIAPAMKTRPDEPLHYEELARQGARIERSFAGSDLPRWAQVVRGDWHAQTTVEFHRDAHGRVWVDGECRVVAGLLCARCSEVLDHAFTASVSMCVVADEASASELAGGCDVLVAAGDSVLLADIIEDELLLTVPEQLCASEDCERRLPLDYPALEEPQGGAATRTNPFDVLAALKQGNR